MIVTGMDLRALDGALGSGRRAYSIGVASGVNAHIYCVRSSPIESDSLIAPDNLTIFTIFGDYKLEFEDGSDTDIAHIVARWWSQLLRERARQEIL